MDAYNAAQINFDMLSSGSLTTEEVIAKIKNKTVYLNTEIDSFYILI